MAQKQLEILDAEGKAKGQFELNAEIFDREVNNHLLYLASVRQEANARAGTAHTKTRTEVRGGGAKPWRQKGTGRARAGSLRSPLFAGGGIIHGPRKNVNWTKNMNKKERKLAIVSALIEANNSGRLAALEAINLKDAKTKEFANMVNALGCTETKTLFVVSSADKNLEAIVRASRNIPLVKVVTNEGLSVKDLLVAKKVFFTKDALELAQSRFAGEGAAAVAA